MTAFLAGGSITITRHEGDNSEIRIVVPAVFDMTGRTVKFQVKNSLGQLLIDTPAGTIVNDQEILIPLLPVTTKGKAGTHEWELETQKGSEIITIAKGVFIITRELIK